MYSVRVWNTTNKKKRNNKKGRFQQNSVSYQIDSIKSVNCIIINRIGVSLKRGDKIKEAETKTTKNINDIKSFEEKI